MFSFRRLTDEPEVGPGEGECDRSQVRVVIPLSKQAIWGRITKDALDFFKSQGAASYAYQRGLAQLHRREAGAAYTPGSSAFIAVVEFTGRHQVTSTALLKYPLVSGMGGAQGEGAAKAIDSPLRNRLG